jgi:hypothetical protein
MSLVKLSSNTGNYIGPDLESEEESVQQSIHEEEQTEEQSLMLREGI